MSHAAHKLFVAVTDAPASAEFASVSPAFFPTGALDLAGSCPSIPARNGATYYSSRLVERQNVLVGVMLQSGGAQWLPARVTDISHEGCRLLTCPDMLAFGMTVQIMFPGFAGRSGSVIWTDGDQAGCAFDQLLPSAILDYIIRMSDPAARGGGR